MRNLDADGDGLTNREEYLSGSSPVDGYDSVRLELSSESGTENVILRCQSVVGRLYTVERTDSLSNPLWTTTGEPMGGTGGVLQVNDSPELGDSAVFYRLRVGTP